MTVVIGWIDTEHHHINAARIQNLFCHCRRMGRKSDMAYDSLFFQLFDPFQHAVFLYLPQVALLIDTVQEAKINIVCLQCVQLPVNGFADRIEVSGPSIGSCVVVCSEMNLEMHILSAAGNLLAKRRKRYGIGGCKIEVIDPLFQGKSHNFLRFLFPGSSDGTGSHSQNTDALLSFWQFTIFHVVFLLVFRYKKGVSPSSLCWKIIHLGVYFRSIDFYQCL